MQHKVHNLGMSYSSLLLRQADATLVFNRLFSCKYLSNEFETILWKRRQRFTQIFTIQNNFGATLWAEPISESLKIVFFAILQFSEWQVESKFSESRVKPLKLCKSIFCHKKYFTKRFWRYYVLQKGCSECLKRLILTTL